MGHTTRKPPTDEVTGVPTHIRCEECDLVLLGFESIGPTPVDRDDCPNCSGTEFRFVDG